MGNLTGHIKIKHTNKDKFRCDECDFTTHNNFNMVQHKEEHQGITYPCEICDYKTTVRRYLNYHFRRNHGNERHACEQCDFVGKLPRCLKDHINIVHLGIRFPCPDCEYVGKKRDYLNDHVKNVHKKKLDKSYFDNLDQPVNQNQQIMMKEEKKNYFHEQNEDKSEQKTEQLPDIEDEMKSNQRGEKTPELKAVNNFIEHSDFQDSLQHILAEKFPMVDPKEIDKREEQIKGSDTENHSDS